MSEYDYDNSPRRPHGGRKRSAGLSPLSTFTWTFIVALASGIAFFAGSHYSQLSASRVIPGITAPSALPAEQPASEDADNSTVSDELPSSMPPQIASDPTTADLINPQTPLSVHRLTSHGIGLMVITGGIAGTRRALTRMGVEDFVQRSGAQAGLNGTFFANASLHGTDNLLIGPSLCGDESKTIFSPWDSRPDLAGRPLVLISPGRTRIVPYDPGTMDSDDAIRNLLPGVTDAFLGGVWLDHNGLATDRRDMLQYHVKDANDPRRRAFFGITSDGRPLIGATTFVATSIQLARAISGTGIQEAVLLDSGFSTALVKGDRVLITGHTLPGIPSRPVPHAILLFDSRDISRATAPMTDSAPVPSHA